MIIANMSRNDVAFPVGTIVSIPILVTHTTMQYVLEIKEDNAEQDMETISFDLFECFIFTKLLSICFFPPKKTIFIEIKMN